MAALKVYDYNAPKSNQVFTAQLSDEDVERYRKAGFEVKERKAPANKAGTAPANKAG